MPFFGIYRATVADTDDPRGERRIQVTVLGGSEGSRKRHKRAAAGGRNGRSSLTESLYAE